MDLMEIQPLEIVHRAGKKLHLPDLLSRLRVGAQGAVTNMHEWMKANQEKIARHTKSCTQEGVDEEVKNKWGPWLKEPVLAVDDTMS